MDVEGTGVPTAEDGPPPVITDSEGEEEEFHSLKQNDSNEPPAITAPQGNNCEWFTGSDTYITSLVLPDEVDGNALKTFKQSLEGVIQYVLSNQMTLAGVEYDQNRWILFLTTLVSKYNRAIEMLTVRHSALLKDTNVLLEEGSTILDTAVAKEDNRNFTTIKKQLVLSGEILPKLMTHTAMLQDVTSPVNLSVVRRTLIGGAEIMLLCCEEEGNEKGDDGQPSVFETAMDVVNSAENLSLASTDLIEKLNDLTISLTETVATEKQRICKNMQELEFWTTSVNQLCKEEPQRLFEGKTNPPSIIESSTGDEIEEVEEDTLHPELLLQSQSSPDDDEETSQVIATTKTTTADSPPLTYCPDIPPLISSPPLASSPHLAISPPLSLSLSSNGSPLILNSPLLTNSPPLADSPVLLYDHSDNDSPGLPPPILSSDEDDAVSCGGRPIDLTVSIDPDDKDFMKKVEEHIFSPEVTKTHQNIVLEGRNITVTSSIVTDMDSMNDNKPENKTALDDPEITPTHTTNTNFNLIPTQQDTEQDTVTTTSNTLAAPVSKVSEFSPVDVGSELYNLDKTLEGECEEEEESDDDYDDGGSKEGCSEDDGDSSRTDDSNIEWIKSIGVFEYRLSRDVINNRNGGGTNGRSSGIVDDDELMDYGLLINELEAKYGSMHAKIELKDSIIMDFSLVKDCLTAEIAQSLQQRIDDISQEWATLGLRLVERIYQLKFEWSQTELLLWFRETVAELQAVPTFILLPEEMQQSLEEFMEYFEDIDQIGNGEDLLMAVRESILELQQCDKNEERFKRVLGRLEEAYEVICDRIHEQREFLQYGIDEWNEFERVATPLNQWIERVEIDVVHRDIYGNTLDQSKKFLRRVAEYRQELPNRYGLLKNLVATGNEMSTMVKESGPSYRHIDTVVRGITSRWKELDDALRNIEEELSNILIIWQEYTELHSTACDFVRHIDEIAGRNPLQSSLGDDKLLPKFVLKTEIDNFEARVARLRKIKKQLAENPKIGANVSLDSDMSKLETEWTRVREVANGSLDTLWAEHSDWVNKMLKKLYLIIDKAQSLFDVQTEFVKGYPLSELVTCDAINLLQSVQDILTTHEELFFDMRESLYTVQDDIRTREQRIQEVITDADTMILSDEKVNSVIEKFDGIECAVSSLRPALQLYCSQLHLVRPLQEIVSQIDKMGSATGSRNKLVETLRESKPAFSTAKFESLKQLSYDLDTVYRDQYEVMDKTEGLPSNQEIRNINQLLIEMIPKLEKQSNELHGHLMLMVEWWKEYEEGHPLMLEWFNGMKESIDELTQQVQMQEQNPQELLQVAQELLTDLESHEEQFKSLTSTAQNLLVDMESKQCDSIQFTTQLTELKSSWNDIHSILNSFNARLKKECEDLDCYLEKLGDFSERLNSVYAEFYDELCTAIPPNASQETINRQKQILETFNNKIAEMSAEFQQLKKDGERWGSKAIPEKWMDEFRELSPGVDDSGSDLSHQNVERQLSTSENRLRRMNQMLKERALDLELTQGDAATLMKSATELLDWVETNLNQEFLHERPPGELDGLLINSQGIKAIKESFEARRRTLQQLHEFATSSKGTLSEANLKKIELLMAKLDSAWEKMDESLTTTQIITEEVLSKVEAFNDRYNVHNEWQEQAEQTLQNCLPIEADLERLEEQQEVLESLNTEILEHKRIPEELSLQADAILELSKEGTGKESIDKVRRLQQRFCRLEEEGAESIELCEEARNDVQVYNGLEKEFKELLDKLEESFNVLKTKPKKPIGNVQETVDEHLDYCTDVESKAEVFNNMYECGRRICKRYPPSQTFKDSLTTMTSKWEEFVQLSTNRWAHYSHLKELWKEFEKIVKDFLEWLMAEGKGFSKDVTTLGGEKGVFDHMKTCENLKNSLKDKGKLLDEITLKADELQAEDGEKPNGTKDVDSRLNDVSIHWNSVCQLLSETLDTLAAVHKKLLLINEITMNEQDWINDMATALANKRTTQGVVDSIKEEMDIFNNYLEQFENHRPAFVVILETEEFVLEHTSCLEHDDIKQRVKELTEQFEQLEESGKDYVSKLEKSVPLWEMFNKQKAVLLQWVQQSQQTYSDGLTLGNATVTRKSLENAEFLYNDIESHFENVQVLNDLMKELSTLCVSGDIDFLTDHTNSITDNVNVLKENTESQKDLLESRMESWKVFPVEAAVEVQEFLEAVSKEVEENDDFDDCSAEELILKLERLERLQYEQGKRRGSAMTLDSSASNEEVQKALAKNPDISQERTTLLKGWSSSSSQLTTKLQLLRLKADMTLAIEKRAKDCFTVLDRYQDHLSLSLPHSIALQKLQTQWQQTEQQLRDDCIEAVNDLIDTHKENDEDDRIQVPKRLTNLVTDVKLKHEKLKEKSTELIDHMTERVQDWVTFKDTMESLSDWLTEIHAELKDICRYYMFLVCFQDALDRHRLAQNQIKKKLKDYRYLQQNYQRHLAVERKPSIIAPRLSLKGDMSMELLEQDGDPLTQGERDTQDGDTTTQSLEEEVKQDEGDVRDTDLIHYQSQWTSIEENWTLVNTKLEDFLTNKEPWEKMADHYMELDEWKEEMKERIGQSVKRGKEISRLDGNPGPLTETYKQFQIEIDARNRQMTDLQLLINNHLTQQLCTMHLTVREFIISFDMLKDELLKITNTTDELAHNAMLKMEVWERKASDCMKRVPLLENEIDNKTVEIINLNDQIGQLRRAPPPPRPKTSCYHQLLQLLLFLILFSVLCSILIFTNLNNSAKYHFFNYLQQWLPFFTLSTNDHSPIIY